MMSIIEEIKEAIVQRRKDVIEALVEKAVNSAIDPEKIMAEGLISPMDLIGKQFSDGTIFVPEMMLSAMIMKSGLEKLKPYFTDKNVTSQGTVLIGTVKGDMHDIGKNIVIMMLEASGFTVIDLGTDVQREVFVEKLREHDADILAMSALLTTTMGEIKNVIKLIKDEGIRDRIGVIVGGAPIDQAFAQEVGADGYGADATEAVKVCKEIINNC
jgi:5-methyltetrahydrofolate--homocysteine methyltransferase